MDAFIAEEQASAIEKHSKTAAFGNLANKKLMQNQLATIEEYT